jgi:hypothetical protein
MTAIPLTQVRSCHPIFDRAISIIQFGHAISIVQFRSLEGKFVFTCDAPQTPRRCASECSRRIEAQSVALGADGIWPRASLTGIAEKSEPRGMAIKFSQSFAKFRKVWRPKFGA